MPLTIQTFDDNSINIVDITKTIIDLAQHPKKLPWTSAHPDAVFTGQFDTLFNRIDRIDHYFDDDISDIKKKRLLKNNTFLSVLCFYEWGQEKFAEKYRPILSIYSSSVMINDNYVNTVIENIQRIIAPGKFLIFTSKNPDFITKSINDGQIFKQDDAVRVAYDENGPDNLSLFESSANLLSQKKYHAERLTRFQHMLSNSSIAYNETMPMFSKDITTNITHNINLRHLSAAFINTIFNQASRQYFASFQKII